MDSKPTYTIKRTRRVLGETHVEQLDKDGQWYKSGALLSFGSVREAAKHLGTENDKTIYIESSHGERLKL